MAKGRTTIQDIANALDVTPSTVSRALQDHPRISDATKKSVRKTADKLNYRPNNIAAALRKGKSNIIGVIIPRANRNIFASIIKGVDEVAHQEGYKVIISQSNDSSEKEALSINTLLDARVDGILASCSLDTQDFSHYEDIVNQDIPLILFDRLHEALEPLQTGAVVIDDYLGAFKATEHLIEQGCKHIVHFSGPQHISIYKERKRGYKEALKRHDMPVNDNLIIESDVRREAGRKLTEQLIAQNNLPDAIFSASDYAAAAAMEVFYENEISIPEDVAVVGFGNEPITSFLKLSSVDQHAEEMGRMAAQLFLDQVNNDNTNRTHSKTVLNPDFVTRNSSLKKRNKIK